MTKMTKMTTKQLIVKLTSKCSIILLLLINLTTGRHNSIECQFLQPQSHLGRLVQSIASPLVLASNSESGDSDSSSPYDQEPASPHGLAAGSSSASLSQQQPARGYYRQQQQQQQHEATPGNGPQQHYQQYRPQHQMANLQQAPSQQRGIPQQYNAGQDDEDSGAPSNQRLHRKQQASEPAGEQYQMGAYLGPTMDDKEIQGAFNSNDDKEEDEAAGYEGPPIEGARGQRASANGYASTVSTQPQLNAYEGDGRAEIMGGNGGGGGGNGGGGGFSGASGQRGEQANFDDELGADEDDDTPGAAGRQPRFRTSSMVNQAAASQYYQRNQPSYKAKVGHGQQPKGGMMAAANGYSPMGAAGPFDFSGLMGAAAGGAPNGAQAYEVYNGDGSYPGQNYYQQQQGQGRRNQAASMNNSPNGYYGQYGPMGYGQPQQQQQQQRGGRNVDQDDAENDQDED